MAKPKTQPCPVQINFQRSAVDCLLEQGGVDLTLGARPMQRTIARLVEGPLAEMLLRGEVGEGSRVIVRGRAGRIVIERRAALSASQ